MPKKTCPRCGSKKLYQVRRGKLRCSGCLYEFRPKIGRLKLKRSEWRKIIFWFVLGHSLRTIVEQTKASHYSVFKAVRKLRQVMLKDVPEVFSGMVEVDETYLGGKKKNKRKGQLLKEKEEGRESKRGFGTTKQPVFGIRCRKGLVWAELVDDIEAPDLVPIIEKKVKRGTKICSDTWRAYTGLATKGFLHRTVEHGKGEYVRGKNHINSLEGFFGYLKRKLAAKGGVKRNYLHLFLGEYVWRYNHREMTLNEKIDHLMRLIENEI